MNIQEFMRRIGMTDQPLEDVVPETLDASYAAGLRLILSDLTGKKIDSDTAKARIRELNDKAASEALGSV